MELSRVCETLASNGFHAVCADDEDAAYEQVRSLIPRGTLVGIGDSVTIRQLGIPEALEQDGRVAIDLFSRKISELTMTRDISMERRSVIARAALNCEFFVTSSNAVTEGGALVSIDRHANRVTGMMFGPKNAVIVVGRNKVVRSVDEAIDRLRNVLIPDLARAKRKRTPCAEVGHCCDCRSAERLCGVTAIIERPGEYITTHVILVDRDLGLGWDPTWPRERIERIRNSYMDYMWLKLGSNTN